MMSRVFAVETQSWSLDMRTKLAAVVLAVLTICSVSQGQVTVWPQRLDSQAGLITVYQPQPTKFEGDVLTARAAVSLTPPGATDPEFGALWFTARVLTDRDARTVTIQNITIKQVKLPNASLDQESQFGQVLMGQVPTMNLMLSLDQLEDTLGVVEKEKAERQTLDNTPPKIVFTESPTTLVVLDGPPKLQASQTAGVMNVINTPFILLLDLNSKQYFLKAGTFWMVAPDVNGPWSVAGNDVPPEVLDAGSKLTAQSPPADATAAASGGPPRILVAEEPTEVISSQGAPTYTPLPGNNLLYMSNTQSDVFLEIGSQQYYVLLSGRWFVGRSLAGPWAFVAADKLPAPFQLIPSDSPKANVLVSIAGSQAARDAKLDAYIPQTSAIRRDSGSGLTVAYDGEPQFVPIENTPITYANNCADPVLLVDNSYYCCHQAVWYRSSVAVGPWAVCDSVPQVIYTIPPSCPVYNCRYVYVYDSTPDVVYCGYLPGYTGCYVYGPTVVYGTGYNYPYWYHSRFIPRPYTYGFAVSYDFDAGTFGFGSTYSFGPTWFADRPERRNWFGPQGYVDYRDGHNRVGNRTIINNVTNVRNVTINRVNIYSRQENQRRNIVVHETVRNEPVAHQPAARELPKAENNVYVGDDGGVYRRTEKGWETHDAKGWSEFKPEEHHDVPHVEQPHEPAAVSSRETPARESPARETPARETPAAVPSHEPVATPSHETPTHESPAREQPARAEPPARVVHQPGDLEAEHVARERGNGSGAAPQRPSVQAPAQAPAHAAGGGDNRQNNGNNGNGPNNPNNRPR
jgi:hypothetical protein